MLDFLFKIFQKQEIMSISMIIQKYIWGRCTTLLHGHGFSHSGNFYRECVQWHKKKILIYLILLSILLTKFKKVQNQFLLGKMKDEFAGILIYCFYGIGAKAYCRSWTFEESQGNCINYTDQSTFKQFKTVILFSEKCTYLNLNYTFAQNWKIKSLCHQKMINNFLSLDKLKRWFGGISVSLLPSSDFEEDFEHLWKDTDSISSD